jgi:hypothetical protein
MYGYLLAYLNKKVPVERVPAEVWALDHLFKETSKPNIESNFPPSKVATTCHTSSLDESQN